jgi:hypothetical protein
MVKRGQAMRTKTVRQSLSITVGTWPSPTAGRLLTSNAEKFQTESAAEFQ